MLLQWVWLKCIVLWKKVNVGNKLMNREEIDFLKTSLKHCKDHHEKDRFRCILLYLEKQKTAEEISTFFYLHPHTAIPVIFKIR